MYMDYLLSLTTIVVIWLMGDTKSLRGPMCGVLNNILWIIYAMHNHQYGLIIGSVVMGSLYIRNIFLWRKQIEALKGEQHGK